MGNAVHWYKRNMCSYTATFTLCSALRTLHSVHQAVPVIVLEPLAGACLPDSADIQQPVDDSDNREQC